MVRRVLLRRTPYLMIYWEGGRFVVHDYATGTRTHADPVVCSVLDFFDRWRSIDGLVKHLADFTPRSVRETVAALERQQLLIRKGRPPNRTSAALEQWAGWNPPAGFFHLSTKDGRYAPDQDAADAQLRKKARTIPMPPAIKRYSKAPRYRLPRVEAQGEFIDVLGSRRTWRHFSRRPLDVRDLSTLLGLTFGVRGWIEIPGVGRTPRKAAPSGGSRHPIEAYVVARRVEGLTRGIYHYRADRHELERVSRVTRRVADYLPTQTYFNGAAALVLMTAVFPRVQWRYAFPRAYRVVLADAGHVCQNFCLTATWLGLAPFCSMALADTRIENDLGIDGVTESVVYAAGVGTRPRRSSRPGFDPA
jgi:SagB-type dehydrogenase family enzyme